MHIYILIELLSNNHESLFLNAECIFSTLSSSPLPLHTPPSFPHVGPGA